MNLEPSIAEWRKQMLAAGIKTPGQLEELESHLREEIGRLLKSGLNEPTAFQSATQQIGPAEVIKMEFKKIDAGNWNRPLAWAAWILFVVSFFLPAYADWPGWQCACLSATAVSWTQDEWFNLHLASLTLANLLMLASPFLLPRFSRNVHALKWLRLSGFMALALVGSFLLLLLTHAGRSDMHIGCGVWAASFLLLCLSPFKIRNRQTIAT